MTRVERLGLTFFSWTGLFSPVHSECRQRFTLEVAVCLGVGIVYRVARFTSHNTSYWVTSRASDVTYLRNYRWYPYLSPLSPPNGKAWRKVTAHGLWNVYVQLNPAYLPAHAFG